MVRPSLDDSCSGIAVGEDLLCNAGVGYKSGMRTALLVVALTGCASSPGRDPRALPETNSACLANAHARQDQGLPALPTPPPAATPKPPPLDVAPTLIEGHRISGQRAITPDKDTERAMRQAGVTQTSPTFKLCLDTQGVPTSVTLLRSSCFPRYDAEIEAKLAEWRYSPYQKDGVAVEVCTAITFIYRGYGG
jgi:hypothetical protein